MPAFRRSQQAPRHIAPPGNARVPGAMCEQAAPRLRRAVNDLTDAKMLANLLKYDSVGAAWTRPPPPKATPSP